VGYNQLKKATSGLCFFTDTSTFSNILFFFQFCADLFSLYSWLIGNCSVVLIFLWCQGFSGFYYAMKDLHLTLENNTFDDFISAVNNCTNILSPVRRISIFHFLCVTAATTVVHLSHHSSACPSVCHTGGSVKNGAS